MIFLRSLFITSLVVVLGVFLAFAQTKLAPTSIALERTPCFGTCPWYKVALFPDGTLTYEGKEYAPRKGKFKAKFWPGDFHRLAELMESQGFRKLKNKYEVNITDQASAITTMKWKEGQKVVDEYGRSGPIELWGVNEVIDGIVAKAKDWEKVP